MLRDKFFQLKQEGQTIDQFVGVLRKHITGPAHSVQSWCGHISMGVASMQSARVEVFHARVDDTCL